MIQNLISELLSNPKTARRGPRTRVRQIMIPMPFAMRMTMKSNQCDYIRIEKKNTYIHAHSYLTSETKFALFFISFFLNAPTSIF